MVENGIVHMTSAPYFPATNGAAERSVQTFKAALRRETATRTPVEKALQQFLTRYCATPHATTGKSPAAMFLQQEPRTRLDLLKDPVKHAEHDNSSQKKDKIFKEKDAVYARLFNQSEKWMSGVVQEEAETKCSVRVD